jgi:hypothetical protein
MARDTWGPGVLKAMPVAPWVGVPPGQTLRSAAILCGTVQSVLSEKLEFPHGTQVARTSRLRVSLVFRWSNLEEPASLLGTSLRPPNVPCLSRLF